MPEAPYRVEKPWGYELIWARTDRYVGKILHVTAGNVLSCQYHNVKDETMHVLNGELILRIGTGPEQRERRFRAGESVHIPPKLIHQIEAVVDSDVLEASTPELDDLVRISDRYGKELSVQVIIPLAGKGSRLRPHTHTVPKPMLKVAGRPVIDWVMDRLQGLDVSELIFITGHLKEQVEAYSTGRYGIPCRYIEQKVQDGTAGAINLARPYVTGPVLIIFVDTVFEADLTLINRSTADGIIWAKEVEDYQRFGVVVTDSDGYMTRIIEKPKQPISKLANIGLYFVKDVDALWRGIDHTLSSPANLGEYFLTDAFQWMIERGRKILTAEVGGWYDCGKLDTLLETNEILLNQGAARAREYPGVTIHGPVLIEDGVSIERSVIGPNVSIEAGTIVRDCVLSHAIVGANCSITDAHLSRSMLGQSVVVRNVKGSASLGDHSEMLGTG